MASDRMRERDDPVEILADFAAYWARRAVLRAGARFPTQIRVPSVPGGSAVDRSRPHLAAELDFTLTEFTGAVLSAGTGAEFMWPGSSTLAAGRRLLLVHVDEVFATRLHRVRSVVVTMPDGEMAIQDADDPTIRYW